MTQDVQNFQTSLDQLIADLQAAAPEIKALADAGDQVPAYAGTDPDVLAAYNGVVGKVHDDGLAGARAALAAKVQQLGTLASGATIAPTGSAPTNASSAATGAASAPTS